MIVHTLTPGVDDSKDRDPGNYALCNFKTFDILL